MQIEGVLRSREGLFYKRFTGRHGVMEATYYSGPLQLIEIDEAGKPLGSKSGVLRPMGPGVICKRMP